MAKIPSTSWPLFTGSACVAGTLISLYFPEESLGRAVVSASANVAGGILSSAIHDWWNRVTSTSNSDECRENLEDLVGSCLETIIRRQARKLGRQSDTDWFDSLADSISSLNRQTPLTAAFRQLNDVADASIRNVNGSSRLGSRHQATWRKLLLYACRSKGLSVSKRRLDECATTLTSEFPDTIREALINDLSSDCPQYPALAIQMSTCILSSITDDSVDSNVADYARATANNTISRSWMKLDRATQKSLMPIRQAFADTNQRLEALHSTAKKTHGEVRELARESHIIRQYLETLRGNTGRYWLISSSLIAACTLGACIWATWDAKWKSQMHASLQGALARSELRTQESRDPEKRLTKAKEQIISSITDKSLEEHDGGSETQQEIDDARTVANSSIASPRQRAEALITLGDFEKADEIIRAGIGSSIGSPSQQELWLRLDGRNLLRQGMVSEAIRRYEQAMEADGEDEFFTRLELVDALASPYIGFQLRKPFADSTELSKIVGNTEKNLAEAVKQLRLLIAVCEEVQVVPEMQALLNYRLGVCEQIRMRNSNNMAGVRKRASLDAFDSSAKLFRDEGASFMMAEARHQQAVVHLIDCNILAGKNEPLSAAESREMDDNASAAIELLLKAKAANDAAISRINASHGFHYGPRPTQLAASTDSQAELDELRRQSYYIGTRLSHAEIRYRGGNRLQRLKNTISDIARLRSLAFELRIQSLGLVFLETWAYQEIAKYEDKYENLTRAVRCFAQQSSAYFNEEGALQLAGAKYPLDRNAVGYLTQDGGEPLIDFSFFRDWLAEGGKHSDYIKMRVFN